MGVNCIMIKLVLAFCLIGYGQGAPECVPRDYGRGSIVCVCNSTYCDTFDSNYATLQPGSARHFVTSKAGLRMHKTSLNFSSANQLSEAAGDVTTLTVNRQQRYQRVLGFGGTVMDAVPINTYSLSSAAADNIIKAYFSEEGIRYSFVRVPIGPTDFSAHYYEYTGDHEYDVTLKYFNLTEEDTAYKIPFLKRAKELSPRRVKLFANAWTAPQWMKQIDNSTGKSTLKTEYYGVYAKYYVKFIEAYKKAGLELWGLTPQNEPEVAQILGRVITTGWTPQQMQKYLVEDLCPTLNSSGYDHLKLMLLDDNRKNIPSWIQLFKNESVRSCVDGLALHWYSDKTSPPTVLDDAHKQNPDKFIIYSEACPNRNPGDERVVLGNWKDGVDYITSLINVTNHWVSGWVDLNMAIDLYGGPNWLNETRDDAPIVVNATADEFYKQPTFYAIAHVSRFVTPGSVRVGLKSSGGDLESVAFLTQNHTTVIVLHNKEDREVKAIVNDPDRGSLSLDIPANSIHTVLYK